MFSSDSNRVDILAVAQVLAIDSPSLRRWLQFKQNMYQESGDLERTRTVNILLDREAL